MKLIVNIPAYNEQEKIAETVTRIKKSFELSFYSQKGSVITEKQIQLVDDGSTDATVEKARAAGIDFIVNRPQKDPKNPRNTVGAAFRAGVENALSNGVDIFVNIDADGQFDPNDIPTLIEPVLDGTYDIVVASRFGKHEAKNMPMIKNRLNILGAEIVSFFLNQKIDDLTCGFRALNKESLLRLNLFSVFTYTQETIIDAIGKNLRIKWIPVKVTYFADRKSKMTRSIWKFVSGSSKIILKAVRDVRPMKFFAWPGLFLIGLGLVGFIVFLVFYFQTFKISPYLNYIIFSSISTLMGIQLLIFALIADMIKSSRQLTEELMYQWKKEKYDKSN